MSNNSIEYYSIKLHFDCLRVSFSSLFSLQSISIFTSLNQFKIKQMKYTNTTNISFLSTNNTPNPTQPNTQNQF